MADTIPISHEIDHIKIPSTSITSATNSLIDQAQYHGWLLRNIIGINSSIPERGLLPRSPDQHLTPAARTALMPLLTAMISMQAPISFHWADAEGDGPTQAAQTREAMTSLLRSPGHAAFNMDTYEIILLYGRAGYINPNLVTDLESALEFALRSRNHTAIRALVELGASTENIPFVDIYAPIGKVFPAGDFDYFLDRWVGRGSDVGQAYLAATLKRSIQQAKEEDSGADAAKATGSSGAAFSTSRRRRV